MRIYLCGQGQYAVQVAEALGSAGHAIAGIAAPRLRKGFTDEADDSGWDRLRGWASQRSLPWTDETGLRAEAVPAGVDVIVAAHSHAFIDRATRDRAGIAAIGYHPSLLPLHRGRDAVRWTIRDRDQVAGGTVYHLTDRADAGAIAAQEHVLVPRDATARSLWLDLLAPMGISLIVRVLADLERGLRIEIPQDESLATWEPAMEAVPLRKLKKPELPAPVTDHNGERASLMFRELMKSKVHRATITQADPAYVGSLTLDEDLMDAADLHIGEKIEVVVLENAARWTTYVMPGPRGSGVVGINGPTARMALPGDLVIVFGFGIFTPEEVKDFKPAVVFVDRENRIIQRGTDAAEAVPGTGTLRGDKVYT